MPFENDAFVAEIVLREGLLDAAQLRRALEIQWVAATVGMDEPLLDVLRTKGILAERDALALQDELTLSALARRPEQVEGYRILQSLGQSGLGALFLAADTRTGAEVALHILSPRLAREPSVAERFVAYAKAVCSLRHPNLERGLTWGTSHDYHYCVLELVEGQSLDDALKSGPVPVRTAVEMARHVAAGLGHMHGLGMVHGDVRPGHVYATESGRVQLAWPGRVQPPAGSGMPPGSPYYLAPEVARGGTPGPRSDLYALGATLYHVLTGRPVVQGESASVACQRQVEMAPLPPASVRGDIPGGLNDLLLRMLAKSPSDRPRNAEEVVRLLAGAMTAPPPPVVSAIAPPAAATPPPEPAPVAARRGRGLGGVWTLLLCLLLCGLGVAVVWAVRQRMRPQAAEQPEEAPRPAPETKKEEPPPKKEPEPAPTPPVVPSAPDEETVRLVAEAMALDRAEPGEHGKVLLALRRASLAAAPHAMGREVEARLAARRVEMSTEARKAYDALAQRVQSLRESDGFGEALRLCALFPGTLRGTDWWDRVEALATNLSTHAEQRYLELAMLGLAALRHDRLDEGLAAYGRIAGLGIPWIAEEGKRLNDVASAYAAAERKRIEEADAARARLQKWRLPGLLTSLFTRVGDRTRNGQFVEALKLLDQVGENAAQGENALAIARERVRIARLIEFWNAMQAGPTFAIGGELTAYGQKGTIVRFEGPEGNLHVRMRIETTGGTVSLALSKLGTEQIAQIAARGNGDGNPAEWRLTTALYLLARGDEPKGRETLLAAQALGADVAVYLEEIALAKTVEKVLEAAGKEDPKAPALLEGLLDNHGTAVPVILNHRQVFAAWRRMRNDAGPKETVETPLPDDLLRLVLLPRARIGATPPADVVSTSLTAPMERGSPVVLGLATWSDYSLAVRWTVEEQGGLMIFFRLGDATPGEFRCGVLSVEPGRLELGKLDGGVYEASTARQAPDLEQRLGHQARITVQGATALVTVDDMTPLRMSLDQLPRGNVGIAVPRGRVFVHSLEITFPPPAKPARKNP